MKIFSSEFIHNYEEYAFGYCNYAVREQKDTLTSIYSAGFLPYSGKSYTKDVFYMARSARINLERFSLSSENRRIVRKFKDQLVCKTFALEDFSFKDEHFLIFCSTYFKERHGNNIMPPKRLLTILEMGIISDIVVYTTTSDEVVAYILEISDGKMTHFWFSFYDLSYTNKSLGMWLMLDRAQRAKENSKEYFYIGTLYGEKAMYKTNFSSLEYWDGREWKDDMLQLKKKMRRDEEYSVNKIDEWKLEGDL